MTLFLYVIIFIVGTIIGSFLNVVIDRIPRGESIIKTRSHCEHCRRKLVWYDLIPIISFILLNGKCRYCKRPISLYYPLVEAITGLFFTVIIIFMVNNNMFVSLFRYQSYFIIFYFLSLASLLLIVTFTDIKFGIIPFKIIILTFVLTFLWHFFTPFLYRKGVNIPFITDITNTPLVNYFFSAFGSFSFFLLFFLLTRRKGLGFGDVIFVFLMGFILGYPKILLGLYIAFISGAIISSILVLTGIKKLRKDTIPFGPFLVCGTLVSLFWGQFIIEKILLYLQLR